MGDTLSTSTPAGRRPGFPIGYHIMSRLRVGDCIDRGPSLDLHWRHPRRPCFGVPSPPSILPTTPSPLVPVTFAIYGNSSTPPRMFKSLEGDPHRLTSLPLPLGCRALFIKMGARLRHLVGLQWMRQVWSAAAAAPLGLAVIVVDGFL